MVPAFNSGRRRPDPQPKEARVTRNPARIAVLAAGGVLLLAALAAGGAAATHARAASGPIKIGISLSLSGDFSDPGKAAQRGYKLWAKVANAKGGVLGRKVQLIIRDDTSSPTQAASNYQTLITRDKVDLVFGPFSTLLSAPSAAVASRYGYAFIEPAGGGPAIFDEKLHNVFFTQPAPVVQSADVFAKFLLSLPASQRPKTASYPALDDPFASPIADRVRSLLEKAGVKTIYKTIYPSEGTDMGPVIQKVASGHPDAVIAGTQSVNGIFSTGDWFPEAKNPGNPAFVAAYKKAYGAGAIDPGSAEAYAAGQVVEAVAATIHSI